MVAAPTAKKLYVDLQARAIPGNMGALDRDMAKAMAGQTRLLAAAKKTQAEEERGALAVARAQNQVAAATERSALAVQRAEERTTRARESAARLALRYQQQIGAGAQEAADRTWLAWDQAERRVEVLAKEAADEQIRQQQRVAAASKLAADEQIKQQGRVRAAQASQSRATTAGRIGATAGIVSGAGSVALGAGVVGAVGGYELIKQGLNWQTFVAQNKANSPMSPGESRAFQKLALETAQKTGANPQDVYMALRYGAEMGLSGPTDRRFLTTALALGLPTGGSQAVPSSLLALATVRKNFPQYANNPNMIGNYILSAAQNAPGVSAPQFIEAIPKLLNLAGHIGGPNQLPQALAIVAALRSAGMPLDESQTQATNMIAKIFKPSPATIKYLASLKKNTGIDLSGDFGPQALRDKGLIGVINDLRSHNLGPTTLGYLFPNMRGYFGALGLTGNQNASFNNIYQHMLRAPQQNPMATNLANYLQLDATKFKELQQALHTTAITIGTDLLPIMNQLIRTYMPMIKDVATWSEKNTGLIKTFVELSPWLIAAGLGLKAVAGAMRLVVAASEGSTLIQTFATAVRGAGVAAEAATGAEAAGGVIGFGESLTVLAAAGGPIALAIIGLGLLGIAINKIWENTPHSKQGFPLTIDKGAQSAREVQQYQSQGAQYRRNPDGSYSLVQAPSKASMITGAATAPAGWHPGMGAFGLPGTASAAAYNRPTAYRTGPHSYGDAWMLGPDGQYQHFPGTSSGAAFHYDLPAQQGQAFRLPGKGTRYTVVAVAKHPPGDADPGYVYTLRGPGGALITVGNIETLPGPGAGMPKFQKGTVIYGGQYGGRVGAGADGAHVHIAGNQAALNLLYGQSPHPRVAAGHGAGHGGAGSFTMAGASPAEAKLLSGAASAYHIDPRWLYGIARQEGGLTTGNLGEPGNLDPRVQANAASATLAYWYRWTGSADGRAAMKAHGFNPDSATDRMRVASAIYNTGPNGPWWKTYYSNASGSVTGGSVSASTPYARGMAYANRVMSFRGGGSSGPQLNYTPSTDKAAAPSGKNNPQTPYQWSEWWASRASGLSGKINQFAGLWPGADLTHPNAQQRAVLTPLLDTYYKDQYQSNVSLAHSEYKNNPGLMRQALAAAAVELRHELSNPFSFFASSTTASSRVSPVQVVGSNRQLGLAEAQNKHLQEVIAILKRELANDKAIIALLQKSLGVSKGSAKVTNKSIPGQKHGTGGEPVPSFP